MPPTTSSAAVTTREAVFAAEDDARYFLGRLARYRQRFGFRLFHYALLTNHFHLLIQLDKPRRLASLMAGLLLAYVRYFNRKYGFVGHLWQGRFKSPIVQRQGHWLSCGRYIERTLWRRAIGDEDFRVRMAEVLGRPLPGRRGRPPKRTATQGHLISEVS